MVCGKAGLPAAVFHAVLGALLHAGALTRLHALGRTQARGEDGGDKEQGSKTDDVFHVMCGLVEPEEFRTREKDPRVVGPRTMQNPQNRLGRAFC